LATFDEMIESAAWLALNPDIAVARAELKPMETRLRLHYACRADQRSTFSRD
jgi:hypothetical protein